MWNVVRILRIKAELNPYIVMVGFSGLLDIGYAGGLYTIKEKLLDGIIV